MPELVSPTLERVTLTFLFTDVEGRPGCSNAWARATAGCSRSTGA